MEKQHILDEIRRTAEANSGAPLGQNRFYTETGIKITDWHGKHWVRWGDALTEAGFARNEWGGAYEEENLISILVGFIRELGHYPVKGEYIMKSRNDPKFPAYATFANRGSKTDLQGKVLDFCKRHEGYDDVARICEPLIKVAPVKAAAVPANASLKEGFVYMVRSGKRYKIGATDDLATRTKAIGVQMPDPTSTVHYIRTDDPFGIEAYWHKRFADKRTNGEWFDLTREDVAAFKRRKTM